MTNDQAENPAVVAQESRPPAWLEDLQKDATQMAPWARTLLAGHLYRLHKRMKDPDAPPTIPQQQAFLELLAKIGDVYPKAQNGLNGAAGSGFSVNIVLNAPSATKVLPKVEVVEQQTPPVPDGE